MSDIDQVVDNEVEEEPRPAPGATKPGQGSTKPARGTTQPAPPGATKPVEDHDASEVAGDLDELVATAAQRDEYLALAQRTQADFENYRKRVARESALAHERGAAKLAKELLPALDSLDRALEGAAEDDPLLDGVRLVRSELTAALQRVGIEAFAPLGETFDPNTQEAVAQQPVDGCQSGTVAEVYQKGYRTSGGVIRPARVLVAA